MSRLEIDGRTHDDDDVRTSGSRQKHEGERFGKGSRGTVFEYSTKSGCGYLDGVKTSSESGQDRDSGHEEDLGF